MSNQNTAVSIVIYTSFKPTSQAEDGLDAGGFAAQHSVDTTGNIFVWITAMVKFDLISSE